MVKDHGEREAVIVTPHEDGSVSIGRITGHLYGPDGSESLWRDQGKKPER